MQNLENLDIFEILITQKLLKCPKDPFVRSALIYIYIDLSLSVTCVFEGSLNDVIMAQHAKT